MSASPEAKRAYRAFEKCSKLESEAHAARHRLEQIESKLLPAARKEAKDCASYVSTDTADIWDVEQVGRLYGHYCAWFFRDAEREATCGS